LNVILHFQSQRYNNIFESISKFWWVASVGTGMAAVGTGEFSVLFQIAQPIVE
jgi:hypothetical protein